ncbi:uncharacterized protein [Rhodnius prolixus]|uniref:uncharacterized protein n=1 Tax=Rhodnius prolixus TaxID=13249 RepID=UPI003D188693
MALSISNPLSSIHIDPSFRFYKLSLPERRIISCDDKNIVDYFRNLQYLHCSLCPYQEAGPDSIYKHLTSETHALNGMRSNNFVGFLIEDMAALIICKRQNINYFFYLHFKALPYEMGMGIADPQFVTIMNKMSVTKENSKIRVSLGDFDLKPEKITNEFSLTVLFEIGEQCAKTLFTKNFLLYDLMYKVQSKKYFLTTANIWRYLNTSDKLLKNIICSCKKILTPEKLENHLETTKCNISAGINCRLCTTLTLFSNGTFLTHVHSQNVCALFEKMNIVDKTVETASTPILKEKSDGTTPKKMQKVKQEVRIKHKTPETVEEQSKNGKESTQVMSKIGVKKKNKSMNAISLSLALLGNNANIQATNRKTLIENLKVYVYNCEKKELNVSRLDELSTSYHVSVLVCCICMKICSLDSTWSHVKTGDHNRRLVKSLPSALFFPKIGELVICTIKDLNFLQHIMFKDTYLLNNITVGDSNSIFISFYNFKLKKGLFKSPPNAVVKDDVKSRIDIECNSKFRLVRLEPDVSSDNPNAVRVFPQSFIIFEFFSDSNNSSEKNVITSLEMNTFLKCLKNFTISCVPCGRKRLKYSKFTKHISGSKFNCGKNCIGVLCHQCLTFSIQPCEECVRHNHETTKSARRSEIKKEKDKNVKEFNVELYEKIDIKEYFDLVNPIRIFQEMNHVKSLTDYLLKALPLKTNINKVTFSCNICCDWRGFHLQEILKHTTSPSHIEKKGKQLEDYAGLCDVCHVFLLDSKRNFLENHCRANHPECIPQDNDFDIIQDDNYITINLITEFSYNLLESFVGKIVQYLNIECKELVVFCMVCFKEFSYSLENFHNHIMQSTHQPRTNDHFSAYCKFCQLLLYNSDIKSIINHFNYHSLLISIKDCTVETSDNLRPIPNQATVPTAVFSKIAMFTFSGERNVSKLALDGFEYLTSVQVTKLFKKIKSKYTRNAGKTFHYTCLQCNVSSDDENECNSHFLTEDHRLDISRTDLYFATLCDDCGILLIGKSLHSFYEHFDTTSHFLNEHYRTIDSKLHLLSNMTDKERNTMGYITKSCEDTFSSKEKYDKFVEANLLEFKRAERGLSTLCISLTNDIEKVLSTTYPKAKLHFFGSRISGLAKIKSDIDVFIDVGTEDLEGLVPLFTTIPGLFNIKQVILGAKVPIIKLEHKNTGLSCDISCQDGYGVFNTHLIKLYLTLDERIYKLCATVLEWAKMNGIRGSPKFTSYSLTWMVIFYLMQPEISLVPSVKWLQERFLGRQVIINGWNCSFLDDVDLIKKYFVSKSSGKTLYELMYNFFLYYATLKVETVILFPYTGELISNSCLSRYRKAPILLRNIFFDNNGDRLIRNGSFRLMDPFILTCNIVQNIRKNELKLFQTLCVHTLRNLNWVKDTPL